MWRGSAAKTVAVTLTSVVLMCVLGMARTASASGVDPGGAAHPVWGAATDGVSSPLLDAQGLMPRNFYTSSTLYTSDALNAVADDIVGAGDMKVVIEDDPVEWSTLAGPDSERVLGFVYFRPPPSPLYHTIFLGPITYPAMKSWVGSGNPAGIEYQFAVSAMTLIHESFHWRRLSGDESSVNACALAFFPYYLERDFKIPQSTTQTTYVKVAVKTVKSVPVKKVVWTTKRVKVNGKWVTRRVPKTVTTNVTKTSTGYVTQPVTTTVPNPLYATLVADAQDFYANQPAPYNSGVCPESPPGTSSPAASYHVHACWVQYTGGSWVNVNQAAAVTALAGSDILARGAQNFWAIVALDKAPTAAFDGTTLTLIQPNGAASTTARLSKPWSPPATAAGFDLTWRWSDDALFFQHPERTGTGAWTFRWQFPDGETCSSSITVS